MKGFKDFVMRGNLVELAVAFIIGAAFATVVTAFTAVVMELITKIAGSEVTFDDWTPFDMSTVGPFLTALVAFLLIAFVVYFFIVKPYEAAKARFEKPAEEEVDAQVQLLTEIRDSLRARG